MASTSTSTSTSTSISSSFYSSSTSSSSTPPLILASQQPGHSHFLRNCNILSATEESLLHILDHLPEQCRVEEVGSASKSTKTVYIDMPQPYGSINLALLCDALYNNIISGSNGANYCWLRPRDPKKMELCALFNKILMKLLHLQRWGGILVAPPYRRESIHAATCVFTAIDITNLKQNSCVIPRSISNPNIRLQQQIVYWDGFSASPRRVAWYSRCCEAEGALITTYFSDTALHRITADRFRDSHRVFTTRLTALLIFRHYPPGITALMASYLSTSDLLEAGCRW